VRVAVLGQGSIGRRHAGILRELGCEVVTFDPAFEGREASEEAALAGAGAAVVASPPSEHERQALLALDKGVPVLVEKPLAVNAEGATRIEARCTQTGGIVDVAMNLRHHPGVLGVRALMGDIGRVVRASAWSGSWLPGWRPGADYRLSYSSRRALGGGVLLDAIHEIDYVLWLLGPARRAGGMTAHASSLELDVEDVATVNIEHESGALSSITLDYVDRAYHRGCRVVGEHGSLHWDWTRATVRFDHADGSSDEHPAAADVAPTYHAQMHRFLSVARGEAAPLIGVGCGRAALEIVDAVRRDELDLRPAGPHDLDRLLDWRNDPVVRAASRSSDEIPADHHAAWYAARLEDGSTRIFIIEHRGAPVGQVRVDRLERDRGEIHIALSAEARNRRLASPALRLALGHGARPLGLRIVVANVRETNIASLRAFARAGFVERSQEGGWVTLEWACTSA
jgi:predicted dehydrogenase/L-amino acid N-acyltransferase YncA